VPKHFVLYGGTAVSLRLGHRQSVDFDFFTSEKVVPGELLASIPLLGRAKILQNWSCDSGRCIAPKSMAPSFRHTPAVEAFTARTKRPCSGNVLPTLPDSAISLGE
jgi:hypothetical protein